MHEQFIFNFHSNLSGLDIPKALNNPFGQEIPEIAQLASKEFQKFIESESKKWEHDFTVQKGKMFGVLVVQKTDETYAYLGTVSGKLLGKTTCTKFIPSVFDDATDDFFINKGMSELTEIGIRIKESKSQTEIIELTESRKLKSVELQQRLFENYRFLNLLGQQKNVLEIFTDSSHGKPPAAAGECAAPKLLQFAFENNLTPIALAEFWWGKPPKNQERKQQHFYPACKNKCRPIVEFMLDNTELYKEANS